MRVVVGLTALVTALGVPALRADKGLAPFGLEPWGPIVFTLLGLGGVVLAILPEVVRSKGGKGG